MGWIHQCCSVFLVYVLRNVLLGCVQFVQCTVKEELCLFKTSFAINHVNQVVRGTRGLLMDSSSLSGIMKGVGGCAMGYEFTSFASIIIIVNYIWWRRR